MHVTPDFESGAFSNFATLALHERVSARHAFPGTERSIRHCLFGLSNPLACQGFRRHPPEQRFHAISRKIWLLGFEPMTSDPLDNPR